jgi:rhamnose utilization protein RhaD (predicted bifunctional aldolase and dehydrogenase)
MSSLSDTDVPAAAFASGDPLEAVVHYSRLVGRDPSLVLRGGGNTSVKLEEADVLGRSLRVLRVKGSGSDLASIRRSDFAGVRLDDVLPLFGRGDMSDEEMVAYLARCLTEPTSPRPSIETLLHAFIPAKSVFHSHADAILSLVNTADPHAVLDEAFGDAVLRIPYRRPGFLLSREVGEAVRGGPARSAWSSSTTAWSPGATPPRRRIAATWSWWPAPPGTSARAPPPPSSWPTAGSAVRRKSGERRPRRWRR